jgi:phosphoinositide-3-kinase regulatory subunit 4
MGNAAYRQTTTNPNMDQDLKTFMQSDLPRFVWQERIGNGKFMKSYLMRVESTQLVVKVYMKLSDEDLQSAATKLTSLWKTLSPTKFPSLMPYQMWIRSTARIKTPNIPVYLIRQYFHYNLFDRLSTRPFLNELEKYWIIFQLLKCLEICHEHKIVHGDIKPENIMCTTSNWVVLTDFAPFKPSYIPDDDPTDFQFYFDSMARHKCYIAPERFSRQDLKGQAARNINSKSRNKSMSSALEPGAGLTPSMDVFSVGCVIAEVLLDGTPFLDFPSMLQYLSSPVEGLGTTISAKVQNPGSRDDEEVNPAPSLKSEIDESPAKQLLLRIKNPLMRAVSFRIF